MKHLIRSAITHPWILRLAWPLTRGAVPVFMLHRFAPASGGPGHDVAVLRADLAWLRRNRFTVLSLTAALERLREGVPLVRTVVFTVDDGYADFAARGLPAFAEFDCPVTVFLTTGFLDGTCWMWWDAVEYLIMRTARASVTVDTGQAAWSYAWPDPPARRRAALDLTERLKTVPEVVMREVLSRLASDLDVELPARPTDAYAPLTWDEVRSSARLGVTFGPHSLTHPILSRTDDARAAEEIAGSWRRLQEEVADAAVPVFCYPNGDPGSFGRRDQEFAARAGLTAAVSTVPGYADAARFGPARPLDAFAVPRMAYVQEDRSFVQVASGLERAKLAVRAASRRRDARGRTGGEITGGGGSG